MVDVSPGLEQLLGRAEAWLTDANGWQESIYDLDRVMGEATRCIAAGEPFHLQYGRSAPTAR